MLSSEPRYPAALSEFLRSQAIAFKLREPIDIVWREVEKNMLHPDRMRANSIDRVEQPLINRVTLAGIASRST